MNAILIKIFATALALSQVTTQPDAIKTQFDPERDRAEVVALLRAGCAHMRKAFDIEDLNLDELITTAMDDPKALTEGAKAFRGLSFSDLHLAYRQFCKNETVDNPSVDLAEVIAFYNKAVADLPDHTRLKGLRLPGTSVVLDAKGERFTEVFEPDHRRLSVPLADIPELTQKAFVAAEDKRFYQHKGIDERGIIRAFVTNLAQPGRPQGGSTITQQVVKNLLVGDDVTYERKIREMIVASRVERTLSKGEILELYLNSIYLGRSSWGVEMAARSYFGKPAKELSLTEGALLAGLTKGPSYYGPDRHPDRAQERLAYVLNRLKDDGAISPDEVKLASAGVPRLAVFERPRRDSGFYFTDHLTREAKATSGVEALTRASYTVRSTIDPVLQRAAEASLQEGLARYELASGRAQFSGPEANLGGAIRKIEAEQLSADPQWPTWRQALETARLPLYDVHWPAAIVLDRARQKGGGEAIRVGLRDGRVLPLNVPSAAMRRALKVHDVIYVRVVEAKGKGGRAEPRMRPSVQGAALVLENRTGRILAMTGGFSYPLSQLNRVTQARRQPGSTFKPLTFLAALKKGLQPNTLVLDTPLTLSPIGNSLFARERDYWAPKNYDGGSAGVMTLRRGLENSKNLVTAHLLDGGIERDPGESLDRVCEIALEAQLYTECERYYPFVLGAQPVRLVDLAAFYAAIANEGARPVPHAIEALEQGGRVVYRHPDKSAVSIGSVDRAAFYQLKSMLQGVLARGTATSIRQLSPYVAGKTGTSDKENDAWFVGFTNDVTVAVWIGYDNADGKRRTLGGGHTGAKAAIPIFEPIIQAVWASYAPRQPLSPPSAEARQRLVELPVDLRSGERVAAGTPRAFMEHFRLDQTGRLDDTQHRLVTREEAYAYHDRDPVFGDRSYGAWGHDYGALHERAPAQQPWWRETPRPAPTWRGPFGLWGEDQERRRPNRVDPDYLWGRRLY